jgi:pimeloyl-ACP methyl ester carboxylesterase
MIYRSAQGRAAVEQRYHELLAGWPVPNKHLTVPTRQGDTFIVASGPSDAPPLVALQGSGANAAMWLRQVAAWSERHRVYAVDVIGEPGLSAPSRPPLASGSYALWLEDVLAGLGLGTTAFVGVSLGGWLAIDYATRHPHRVARLVLLNPSGIGRTRVGLLLRAIALRPLGDWGRRRMLAAVAGSEPGDPTIGEFALLIFRHFIPRLEAVPRFDDATLRNLTMPVLAVLGTRDALIDAAETARRLRSAAPHADIRMLPDAGHILPDPTDVVLGWLPDDDA